MYYVSVISSCDASFRRKMENFLCIFFSRFLISIAFRLRIYTMREKLCSRCDLKYVIATMKKWGAYVCQFPFWKTVYFISHLSLKPYWCLFYVKFYVLFVLCINTGFLFVSHYFYQPATTPSPVNIAYYLNVRVFRKINEPNRPKDAYTRNNNVEKRVICRLESFWVNRTW